MILEINQSRFRTYGGSGFFVVVFIVFLLIIAMVKQHQKTKAENEALSEELETEYELPPVDAVNAVVLGKDIVMEKNVASPEKIVRTHKLIYNVQFSTEDGNIVEYDVPQELFDYINIGQRGTLATVDGEFFDFGDGEEINI